MLSIMLDKWLHLGSCESSAYFTPGDLSIHIHHNLRDDGSPGSKCEDWPAMHEHCRTFLCKLFCCVFPDAICAPWNNTKDISTMNDSAVQWYDRNCLMWNSREFTNWFVLKCDSGKIPLTSQQNRWVSEADKTFMAFNKQNTSCFYLFIMISCVTISTRAEVTVCLHCASGKSSDHTLQRYHRSTKGVLFFAKADL